MQEVTGWPAFDRGIRLTVTVSCPDSTTEDRLADSHLRCARPGVRLAADAEPLDKGPVSVDVGLSEVVEQATTPTHEKQQSPAAVVVVLVEFQVLGELSDPMRQNRDLDLGASGITFSGAIFGN